MGGENAHILASCNAISDVLAKRMQNPMPFLWQLPTRENLEAAKGLAVLQEYAGKLLDERLSSNLEGEFQKDLLAAMVAASRAEEGSKGSMSRTELIDNIGTIFFGAYDTTSATIAFTLHLLAQNPSAQDVLAAELASINLGEVDRDQLELLPYLDGVCREANRLTSTASAVPRTAKEDLQLGSYHISRGTNVIVDHLSLTARDPELWGGQQDLDDFRPDRWSEMKPHRLASLPFGFGGRICPGNNLATLEHKFITASLIHKYRWELDASRPMETTSKVGLCPKDGCWLIPSPR
jgi:cytochrome P450